MPSPRGKKLHLRGKKRPKDLFHIALSPKLHFHGLSETGGLTGGEIFQMVCLYPVTVSRMWALSHQATFWRGCSLSHYNFGGSDRAAASPGAISLKLNLQDNLRGGAGRKETKPIQNVDSIYIFTSSDRGRKSIILGVTQDLGVLTIFSTHWISKPLKVCWRRKPRKPATKTGVV